jgi:hypothetical protein
MFEGGGAAGLGGGEAAIILPSRRQWRRRMDEMGFSRGRERESREQGSGGEEAPPTEIGRRPVHRGQGGDDGSSPRDAADDSGGGPPAGGAHRVQGGGGLEREAAATEAMRRAQWLATSATATPSASPPLPRIHLGPPGLPRPKRKCQGASG